MSTKTKQNILTIPNDMVVDKIEYSPNFSCICSVGKSPFWGKLFIVYSPNKNLVEFESFEKWLREVSTFEMTIEEFNRFVYNVLSEVLEVYPDEVSVYAHTLVHGDVRSTIRGNNVKQK